MVRPGRAGRGGAGRDGPPAAQTRCAVSRPGSPKCRAPARSTGIVVGKPINGDENILLIFLNF